MSRYSLLLVFLLSASMRVDASKELSYADLAQAYLPLQLSFVLSQLNSLDDDSVPCWQEVKTLRSNVMYARELLGAFSQAYPYAVIAASSKDDADNAATHQHATSMSRDVLLQMMSDLTEGYTRLGDFEVYLSRMAPSGEDAQSTWSAAEAAKVMAWQEQLVSHLQESNWIEYLAEPSHTKLFERTANHLQSAFHPSLSLSGYANLALLATSLMEHAAAELPATLTLEIVCQAEGNAQLRRTEDLLRSLFAVMHFFPDLLPLERAVPMLPDTSADTRPWSEKLADWASSLTQSLSSALRHFQQPAASPATSQQVLRSRRALMMTQQQVAAAAAVSAGVLEAEEDIVCAAPEDLLQLLETAFKAMEQIESHISMHRLYQARDMTAEAARSEDWAVALWQDVSAWMQDHQLAEQLLCARRVLLDKWSL